MAHLWREADSLPIFEHAWLFDHFQPIVADRTGPCLEGWTLLAALAAQTQRLRVGVMVTGVTCRHPAVLANMAATVDVITHGRLEFGIGAAWNEREHASYGIPFYPDAERIRRLGEACEVIRRLWTQSVADFDGRYYQLKEACCEPKPIQQPHPPLVIGRVSLDGVFFEREEMEGYLREVGFAIEVSMRRSPYTDLTRIQVCKRPPLPKASPLPKNWTWIGFTGDPPLQNRDLPSNEPTASRPASVDQSRPGAHPVDRRPENVRRGAAGLVVKGESERGSHRDAFSPDGGAGDNARRSCR